METQKTPSVARGLLSPLSERFPQLISGLAAALLFSPALSARAEVRVSGIFSSGMVLQQGMPVPVWGWADEGEEVTVQCQGQRKSAVTKGGKWKVMLPALKAGGGPEVLTVDGKNRLRFEDVLVGEVWICSGQSNMEWPMNKSFESQSDIASSVNANIRLYSLDHTTAATPQEDTPRTAKWLPCNPNTVTWFSAVGYYFGRALEKSRKVPVGLIHTSWGGSPAEVWMSRAALEANPSYLLDIVGPADDEVKKYEDALAKYREETLAMKKEGKTQSAPAPKAPAWVASTVYNAMIAPLAPYAVRGAIWYQGEANADRAYQYRTLFPDLIRNWRAAWGQNDFTFLCVQLAPYLPANRTKSDQPGESAWAELRDAQLQATKLQQVGMVVITDFGDANEKDIHPKRKQPVGERLALAARGVAYREQGLVYSGPTYRSMSVSKDQVTLHFANTGTGLEARGGDLKGFAICGDDRKWVWAKAQISGKKNDEITLSSPDVKKPLAVRFGWADVPAVNLYNKEGLPASPFRTDDFPLTTMPGGAATVKK